MKKLGINHTGKQYRERIIRNRFLSVNFLIIISYFLKLHPLNRKSPQLKLKRFPLEIMLFALNNFDLNGKYTNSSGGTHEPDFSEKFR